MDNKLKAKGFLVWGICVAFFLYEFFLRTVIGTYQHPLMHDLELTSFQFSVLSVTIFLGVYGFMQIPVGIIVDRIGLKKSLFIGATCCTVSAFGFSYAHSYQVAIAFRMLMGVGASFGFICLLASVYDWMPNKYSAIFIGISQFIGTMGPMMAAGPLETMSEGQGADWRSIFMYLGFIGVFIVVLVFLFVENNQKTSGQYVILYKPEKILTSIRRLFCRIQPWYIALLSTCLYFTVEYFSESEGRAFLSLKWVSASSASYMITIAWVGYAIGCPLLGFLSDITERRNGVLRLSSVLGLLSICLILYAPGELLLQASFFILGFSASGQSVGFALMADQFKKQFLAIGLGLNNAVVMTIASINAPVIGFILDKSKQSNAVSLEDYLLAFNILILMSSVAVVLTFFFIKESYCKSQADFTVLRPKA